MKSSLLDLSNGWRAAGLTVAATMLLSLVGCAPAPQAKPTIQATLEKFAPLGSGTGTNGAYCATLKITGQNFPAASQVQLAVVGSLIPPVPAPGGSASNGSLIQSLQPTTGAVLNTKTGWTKLILMAGCETPNSGTLAIVAFDPMLQYGASTTVADGGACPNVNATQAELLQVCPPLR